MESYEELLIQAIKENDIKYLDYCLFRGANPNKIAACGKTPLGIAAQHGNLGILRTLADHVKHSLKNKKQPLYNDNRKGLNLNLTVNKINKNIGYFVVCRDIEENDFGEGPTPDGMEDLEWDMEVRAENESTSTPPEARIYKWYADVLNRTAIVLESPENDIGRYDRYGLNALHYAVIEGHCDIVEHLIDNFTDISVNQTDADMFSPLHIAANNGDTRMVTLLLEKGADKNHINRQRHTPLHLAAHKGYMDIINLLIEKGANLNVYDLEEFTPLTLSILHGHQETAKLLIRNGTRLNLEESNGYTVLYRAVWNNMTSVAKALIDAGAKIIQSHYLLHMAIRHNNFDLVKILCSGGALLNIRNAHGLTPLMFSCVYKNIEVCKFLLEEGALIGCRNEMTGLTALHVCADSIRDNNLFIDFLELLLSYNADINATSYMGNILFYSIIVGNLPAACTLIRYGADVNLREERGFLDNLTLAKKNGNADLVKLIVYAGFNFSNMLFEMKRLKMQNDDPVYDFLAYVSTRPLKLKDICRMRIRNVLHKNVIPKIKQLPLPKVLLRYLALEEI